MRDQFDREPLTKELCATGRYLMEHGLAWGNAGNISARLADDRFLITASGTYMGELSPPDIVECSVDGTVYPEDRKPSKEIPMHGAVYATRPDIQAVLHASPFYSTMLACSDVGIPGGWFVESMYYLERVERVPYHHPGSAALGQAVREKAPLANILLLEHHGVLVYDVSVQEARMALQTLEFASRMLVTSRNSNIGLRVLDEGIRHDFLHHAIYKPRRKWEH